MIKSHKQLVLLLIAVLIIIFREYMFFTAPRFWAEEGSAYFSFAASHSWLSALFKPHFGYYSLFNNLAVLLASRAVPLENAPLVTTTLAFLVQCIPLLIVIWGNSDLWNTYFKKVVMVAIILFTPLSGEVWLNTINSQFYFSLITFLILCEDVDASRIRKYFYRTVLVMAGLTGVVSCFLAPLYLVKAWLTKQREAIIQVGIIGICTLLQIVVAVLSVQSGMMHESRISLPNMPTLGAIIGVKDFALPFCGLRIATMVSRCLFHAHKTGGSKFTLLGYGCLLVEVLFLWFLAWRFDNRKRIFILGSFLLLTLLTTYSSYGNKAVLVHLWSGQRYYYIPNVLMLTMVFLAISWKSKTTVAKICGLCLGALLIIALLNGALIYKSTTITDRSWPVWSREVAKWEKDHSYSLRIWPPGWQVKLDETPAQ